MPSWALSTAPQETVNFIWSLMFPSVTRRVFFYFLFLFHYMSTAHKYFDLVNLIMEVLTSSESHPGLRRIPLFTPGLEFSPALNSVSHLWLHIKLYWTITMLFFCLSVGPFCDIITKFNDYGRDHMILEDLFLIYLKRNVKPCSYLFQTFCWVTLLLLMYYSSVVISD